MSETTTTANKPYRKIAFESTWSGRGRGLWAGAMAGIAAGAAVGLAAPFFPVIAGMELAAAIGIVAESTAIFSATGLGIGSLVGAAVGAPASATSAIIKEHEARTAQISNDPELTPEQQQALNVAESEAIKNELASGKKDKYVNLKVGIMFAGLGMIGGLIMAAGFMLAPGALPPIPGLDMVLTAAQGADKVAITSAYFMGVMGSFGALWSCNFPKIVGNMEGFVGRLMSGELLGTSWEKTLAPALSQALNPEPELAHESFGQQTEQHGKKLFTDMVQHNPAGQDLLDNYFQNRHASRDEQSYSNYLGR